MTNLKGFALQQYMNSQRNAEISPRPPSPQVYATPQRSLLQMSHLSYSHAVEQGVLRPFNDTRPVVYVIAHLPPGADIWINEELMYSDVQRPEVTMVSPPLEPGKLYTYTARVRWAEDGKWVGQMHTFDVRVGDVHHMTVTPASDPSVQQEIAANLAKLNKADREAAEKQKFCAVQNTIPLGSMGTPVKVTVKGKEVFLCCPGCKAKAGENPDKTKAAEQNKEKN